MYEPCNENRTTPKISLMMSREDKVEVAQFIIDRFYENCERDGIPLSRSSRRQKPLPQSAFEPRPISLPPFSRQEELDRAEAAYKEALANKQYGRLADLARSRTNSRRKRRRNAKGQCILPCKGSLNL